MNTIITKNYTEKQFKCTIDRFFKSIKVEKVTTFIHHFKIIYEIAPLFKLFFFIKKIVKYK